MSNTNPGGSRNKFGGRIFGASNIKRMIQQQKVDPVRDAHTSIADKPHAGTREQQRRLRQEQRRIMKQSGCPPHCCCECDTCCDCGCPKETK